METCFASPQRTQGPELRHQIQFAAENPVINSVMSATAGLLAVLNKDRQIIAVNRRMLDMFEADNPELLFGLRPGEAVGCRYAHEMPAGCGTSEYCINCGAAIAIVTSLQSQDPVERTCATSVERGGKIVDFYFRVTASSIHFGQELLILLFLQDITREQNRAVLERVFFHDVNNIIMGLINAGELLGSVPPEQVKTIAGHVVSLSSRLGRELEFQRHLMFNEPSRACLDFEYLPVDLLMEEAWQASQWHPAAKGKSCQIQNSAPGSFIDTDMASLVRVIGNMLINALEAAEASRIIRFDACKIRRGMWFLTSGTVNLSSRPSPAAFFSAISVPKEIWAEAWERIR